MVLLQVGSSILEKLSALLRPLNIGILAFTLILSHSRLAAQDTKSSLNADSRVWRSPKVCGHNCLYLFLRLRGFDVDYDSLVKELNETDGNVSLATMQTAAAGKGLKLEAYHVNTSTLQTFSMPVILHLDRMSRSGRLDGHYILLLSKSDTATEYVDGTSGILRSVPWRDIEEKWSGYCLASPELEGLSPRRQFVFGCLFGAFATGTGLWLMLMRQRKTSIASATLSHIGAQGMAEPESSGHHKGAID
jgi:hypothetical protein